MCIGLEGLVVCGLFKCKVEYIFDLVVYFKVKMVYFDKWVEMEDEVVIVEMIQICGIGCWIVEMFLIFNLLCLNVLLLDDLGLFKGISISYFLGEFVLCSDVWEVVVNWELWCIVVIWYLWCSLDLLLFDY